MTTIKTVYYKIEEILQSQSELAHAGQILREGGLVAIPTETVYGLGANALDGKAVSKIFKAKGRPQDNPLIVHISNLTQWADLVQEIPQSAKELAEHFWPGPLTIILPKSKRIPEEVSAGLDTVAVRFPSHPVAQAVIEAAGVPIAAPSANLSGKPSPTTAQHVLEDMDGVIDMVIDGGECSVGVESTVLSLAGDHPVLLRPGGVTIEQIREILPDAVVHHAVEHQLENGQTAASPGMKYKHYAPLAKVTILDGTKDQYLTYIQAHQESGVYALCFEEDIAGLDIPYICYGTQKDALSQAQGLFDALRELDHRGAKTVYAHCPSRQGVGLAVFNRLIRAAGFDLVDLNQSEHKASALIGLTGQTGSGKSTVRELFARREVFVIDADCCAHEVTQQGQPVLKPLSEAFGADILGEEGTLDRKKLAARAFDTQKHKKQLEEIIFPYILRNIEQKIEKAKRQGKEIILLDAPTLFESGIDTMCDQIISVIAPYEIRKQRIMERDHLSEEQAVLRMNAQLPEEFFVSHSDYVLRNDGDFRKLEQQVEQLLAVFLK